MKIAVFFHNSIWCAWSMGHGIPKTLERMGHIPIVCALPAVAEISQEDFRAFSKTAPRLDEVDIILVSGPEHVISWIKELYPKWQKLKAPKLGWVAESVDRGLPLEEIKPYFDRLFFPAPQDEKHGTYLPLGVDTEAFYHTGDAKIYPSGFIGMLYPKRREFLKAFPYSLPTWNVTVLERVGVVDFEKTLSKYRENINQLKVFVNLPMMSNMVGSKVYEIKACGTFYMEAKGPVDAEKITYYLAHEEEREELARAEMAKTRKEDRLELRLETILKAA